MKFSFYKLWTNFYFWILFACFSTALFSTAFAQSQVVKKTSEGIYYLEHLPSNYTSSTKKFPVIIFLHGIGERGDGAAAIQNVKKWGPPRHIEAGDDMTFRVDGTDYSFIVISPQLSRSKGSWSPTIVNDVINHVLKNYKVDLDRVYLTGLSLGGGGTWSYAVSEYNKPNKLAAIAPIAGFLSSNQSKYGTKYLADNDIPVWAFHNSGDDVVAFWRGQEPIDGLKAYNPKEAPRFTVYNVKGHNSWTNAYQVDHSVHRPNLYEWLLAHKRAGSVSSPAAPTVPNQVPIAKAGSDQKIQLPKNYTTLNGNGSKDNDGTIKKYYWKKLSGPSATIATPSSASTTVKSLVEGKYIFELAVTDNKGTTAKDRMTIVVNPKEEPAQQVTDKGSSGENGLHYKYYEGSQMREVADVDKSKSTLKKTGTVPNFTLTPKQRYYYFGFEYEGYIKIAASGTYTFYTTSDDGSALWIGSTKVVNNDGIHGKREKSGKIYLKAGMHPIKVIFFEHANDEILEVKYAGPGISKKLIPNNVLYSGSATNARIANNGKKGATLEVASTEETIQPEEQPQWIDLKAYPNPVFNKLHMEMRGEEGEIVIISLIDQLGQVLYSEEKVMYGDAETFELNVATLGLKPGIVFLQVNSPSYGQKTLKLLKK